MLLKENEKMKKELASVPALQREVERLRATVTELKHIPGTEEERKEIGREGGREEEEE